MLHYAARITLLIEAPVGTTAQELYLGANVANWKADGIRLVRRKDGLYSRTIEVQPEQRIEFKVTRSNWDTVEKGPRGEEIDNRVVTAKDGLEVKIKVANWRDWVEKPKQKRRSTVVGTLKVLPNLYSPQLGNRRDILVYLPPSYAKSNQRYPVVYMHDGQNLFDDATSYAGEWRVDETLEELAEEGLEAIVVGIPNKGRERLNEYSPFMDPKYGGGKGDAYVRFIVEVIKPIIDRDYRTLPQPQHTSVAGSSMGGFISLYALYRFPQVFGNAGVISPAFWFAERELFTYVQEQGKAPGRVYMDVGFFESSLDIVGSEQYLQDVRDMNQLLQQQGFADPDYLYLEDPKGRHNEADWARRLPDILRFLLAPSV